jgi:uncharacterized protein (TIGR01777 family)
VKVAVTGSHGLIGSALAARLNADGDTVVRLVRGPAGPGDVSWDPSAGRLDPDAFAGVDGVVNLAGAGIGDRRWTAARRLELESSRIASTELLSRALSAAEPRPAVLLSGSAVGYYGDAGDAELTEASPPGTGFLADLCRRWEDATAGAQDAGVRVVHLRSGIVLARSGGALAKQLPLFRLGLGGRLGSGRQYLSWITLEDEVRAIVFGLRTPSLSGAANLTAPTPVTSAAFATAMGRVIRRPTRLAVPPFALRLALGADMADEMLLAGQRVLPTSLLAHGFEFAHPTIEPALRAVLA